ncbi:tyrosine-protein phosphatase non-receptor type 9-like [Culicoides brevitarsis]|uniref:tyrosine-protein phosphatase non-receptor type 9-like n=1 Tax=Culicoides brevitarsis TaxID=469753 RepID=UPI00307B3E36
MSNNSTKAAQEQAVKQFIEILGQQQQQQIRAAPNSGDNPVSVANNAAAAAAATRTISVNTALKFLWARKFDVQRAVELYEEHESTRLRDGLYHLNPLADELKAELESGKFTILPGRDASGSAIALFTACLHDPSTSTHKTTLQGIVYQLDAALTDTETQKAGLVFIYDMSQSRYSNFDYDLSYKILTLLKGGYPARLKKVLIVTAPLWFKAPFKILRLFVREKLRERVFTVSIPQLSLHIPRDSLPQRLGGMLEVDHAAWLLQCYTRMIDKDNEMLQIDSGFGSAATSSSSSDPADDDAQDIRTIKRPVAQNQLLQQQQNGGCEVISSASSGFSDDECLIGTEGDPKTIQEIVEMVRQKKKNGLIAEYAEIRARAPEGTFIQAKLRDNSGKNRYTDVLCYDHSRVVLSCLEDDPNSDYINANFVDGYKQKNAYISTQGPLPKTSHDFWRMAWEQHTLVIVMTTRVMERGRVKCGQYWEPTEGSVTEHGHFRITTLSTQTTENHTIAELQIKNLKTDETRHLCHMQFTSWPDYGVPASAMAMLNFLQLVREKQAQMVAELGDTWAGHVRGPPIIIHCSAGIGRTGTFITLDICISRLEDTGKADVRGTVEKIRSQRAFSIQMPDQYVFCHLALIEYAISRGMLTELDLTGFVDDDDEDSD